MEIIKKRRSVRQYTDKQVEKDQVEELLEAARWAPSGGNTQPWIIKAVGDKKAQKINRFTPGIYGSPPVIIVLCFDEEESDDEVMDQMSLAMAAQNICLQAASMGLGTCMIASFDESTVNKILDIEQSVKPVLLVTVGHPEEVLEPPSRKELDEFVEWIDW
ncbi:MAG: nitroreductase family protein [Candidatus Saliniplasma sp.]